MHIFLLILGILLLVIDLLIFCPVCIRLTYDNELTLRVGYLFPVFRILPAKPKQEKPEKKRKKKKQPPKTAQEPEKKKNPFGDIMKERGLGGLIELLRTLAKIAAEAVKKLTDHLVISNMELRVLVATEDASKTALTYGNACAAIFPLVSVIAQHVKKCRHHEMIAPCFTQTETKVQFVLKARIVPFFVLSAGVKALLKTLKTLAKSR